MWGGPIARLRSPRPPDPATVGEALSAALAYFEFLSEVLGHFGK